jgi:acetyl-CoA carboxylase, biotin carboxylase subunit
LRLPAGPGVRVETHVYDGYTVPPFYDSLLAKIVVWDASRAEAIERMKRALHEFELDGLKTTKPLHLALLDNEAVRAADYHTGFLEDKLTDILREAGI